MSRRRKTAREVVVSEQVANEVDELMTLARERGQMIRRARGDEVVHDRASGTQDILQDELRQLLEDEIVPAYLDDQGFADWELHREVTKKALVGLRLETLRTVAESRGLDKRGKAEEVAERIARAYRYDDQEIAKLILDNEEEPQADRAHVSRVFPLASDVQVSVAVPKIRQVVGRFVRAGVARWLEIRDVTTHEDGLSAVVDTSVRAYKAFVDDLGDAPTLGSSPTEKPVTVALGDEQPLLVATNSDASTGRIAVRAVAAVIGADFADELVPNRPNTGHLGTFDDRTVMLLDIVYNRLSAIGVTERNLTVARFVTEKGEDTESRPEEAGEHSLKAVRFEGHHLLDSPQACQLIALSGRGLVDISLWVAVPRFAEEGDETPWFPLRVTLDRDQIGVTTGFGRFRPELSVAFHEALVGEVVLAVAGPADAEALEELATTIYDSARSGEPGSGTLNPEGRRSAAAE